MADIRLVKHENIVSQIHFIRSEKVILDVDLAVLYGVPTKVLKQAVKRNLKRFPEDFMFQLSTEEFNNLRAQIVTSSWGGLRYAPICFYRTRRCNAFGNFEQQTCN